MQTPETPSAPKIRSGAVFGIGLMLLGVFLFAMNDVMGKWLVATYSVGQLLFLRSIAALAVLLPLMRRQKVPFRIPPQPGLHLLRVVLSTLEVACFYWAVTYLPLADVMTYYLAGPIYVAAFAVFMLGERLDPPRILAIAVGFVGVLIVLRPSPASLSLPALIALTGSVFYSLLMIATRKLRDTHDATLVLGQILGALAFGLATIPFSWVTPGPLDLAALFLLGIVSMAGHACVNRSLKLAPASVVAPYQYTLIVWAIVLGYLFFGDVVGFWTLVGAAVICGAGLVLLLLEHQAARRGRVEKDIETPVLPEA
ncbi:DMT family transporter [Microvirga thermotolerans]|uniref:EamA family transporter n=1 Tax=Microvirga thermotolerans TaxID=2651334 RepID=A0A5P9JUM2_9HYPH|nr:DMT family transporter [Microvirga thermotolerans]QFU16123.1 EamA family transporter [Microvirga thermotolerans]